MRRSLRHSTMRSLIDGIGCQGRSVQDLLGGVQELDSIPNLNQILDILEADLTSLAPLGDPDSTSPEVFRRRRSYVRDSFVLFEAVLFQLKRLSLEQAGTSSQFSPAEAALLHERRYSLASNGEPIDAPAHLRLTANIRFAGAMFAKAHGATFAGAYSDPGWASLKQAQRVRDRLTHPKSANDLLVSIEECALVRDAHTWFRSWLDALFDSVRT